MNNNNNELERYAREKIKRDQKFRPNCNVIIGPTGPTGATPTLTIGDVVTGDPGTQASATITGTSPNFILNLTIPQGPTARFNNSSNNIIHKFKQITFKLKKIKYH